MQMKSESDCNAVDNLPNFGPVSRRWLTEIGVRSCVDLEEMGVVEAYCRIKECHPRKTSLVMLWALWGAVNDTDWRDVTPQVKAELLVELVSEER